MALPRVLIVDPDSALAMWAAQGLMQAGFEIAVAFDAATGHTVATTAPPDLMLIDLHVPTSGGPAFARMVRDTFPSKPVGAIYMVPDQQVTPALREAFLGLDDFTLKPLHLGAVVEQLHRLSLRIQNLPDVMAELGRYAGRFAAASQARRMILTIMFADVRGFTGISETRDPETVAAAVNNLLDSLAASVIRFGGVIDKFLGDGMMAVFGMDERSAEHALAAMYAAQEIMDSLTEAHAASLFAGADLGLGIGLHAGDAVVGPVGPPFRRDVTAIGDTVNMASRICGEAHAGEILVSEATLPRMQGKVTVRSARDVMLKGKRQIQRLYSVQLR